MLLFSWFEGGAGVAGEFPAPAVDEKLAASSGTATAVVAGGCFWCTEGVFENLDGVTDVVSGYAGGAGSDADYEKVSSGTTGHAEAIQIVYDPSRLTYGGILKVFFSIAHDPTQLDRQGPDRGRQYRSALFPINRDQKRIAETYIAQLEAAKVFDQPIVTTIEPAEKFYPAEEYHQDFVRRNPYHPYVVVNALPKVGKLNKIKAAK